MNNVLHGMLDKYHADGLTDRKNAIKEILQEIENEEDIDE